MRNILLHLTGLASEQQNNILTSFNKTIKLFILVFLFKKSYSLKGLNGEHFATSNWTCI